MRQIIKLVLFVISIGFISLFSGCSHMESPKPELGVLDLNDWHIEDSGILSLNGEWDFYWNQLLTYEEINRKKPDLIVQVPDSWDNYRLSEKPLPGLGVATYRLRVNSKHAKGELLAFKLRTISSAYRLYINDELVAGAGIVGRDAKEERGEYRPKTAVFRVPDNQFDIIIQVSNYHYARGGLWDHLYLGNVEEIHEYDNRLTGGEAFLIGILLIIALFHFALFLLLRELRYPLLFVFIALTGAISVDTAGQLLLINPIIPFRYVITIWYSATGWMAYFLMLFMNDLFPSDFSRRTVKVYTVIILILQGIYIFVDPIYYTKYAVVSNLNEVAAITLSLLIILFGKKKSYKHRILNAISILIVLIALAHDILYMTNRLREPEKELFYIGVVLSLSLQMIIQAQRIKIYFDNKVSAELLLLQAQIKPHFLYNTINTIISISRFDAERARNLLIDFSLYLRKGFNLKDSNQLVLLSDELELARAYIAIEKARFGKRLTVEFHIQEGMEALKVPMLILQPIIENAIIHGVLPKPEGGRVDISISREGRWLSFLVADNGQGIDQVSPEALLEEKERGIGLSNINLRLRKLYKRGLEIKSEVNKGTEVKWYIFVNRS